MHRTSAVLLLTLPALLSAHPIFSLKLKQEKYDGTLRPSDPLVLENRGVCTKTVVPERKSIDMLPTCISLCCAPVESSGETVSVRRVLCIPSGMQMPMRSRAALGRMRSRYSSRRTSSGTSTLNTTRSRSTASGGCGGPTPERGFLSSSSDADGERREPAPV